MDPNDSNCIFFEKKILELCSYVREDQMNWGHMLYTCVLDSAFRIRNKYLRRGEFH